MNNCYIIIHQGFGDLFNSIGIINYYSNKYDNVYVFLVDNSRIKIYNELFYSKKNIIPIIPEFSDYLNVKHPNTCVICMTNGSNNFCPRINNVKCKYIDYDKYSGDIIKIGSFDNFDFWHNNYRFKQYSFAHAFYSYNNLDPNIRFEEFKLYNNKDKENEIYLNFVKTYGENYILIHEDSNRNFFIDRNKIISKNLPIINLNCISDNFIEYFKVIKNAKEIHLIDSSWSVLIYLLSYKDITTPIFLSETQFINLGRDLGIYKNPIFTNWYFY